MKAISLNDYYPMAVFGTLRTGQWNNHLMHPAHATAIQPALLHGFEAVELKIYSVHNASVAAPFEIFHYNADLWESHIIGPVDRLESFDPQRGPRFGYVRTLAELRVCDSVMVPALGEDELYGKRRVMVAPQELAKMPAVRCWIYSSIEQNEKSRAMWGDDSPILWYQTQYPVGRGQ